MRYDSTIIKLTNELFRPDTALGAAPHGGPMFDDLLPYAIGAVVLVVAIVGLAFYGIYKALD